MGSRCIVFALLVACGSGAPAAAPLSSSPNVTAPPPRAPAAAAARVAPSGFVVAKGDGFSVFVPTGWPPTAALGVALAVASPGGPTDGMSLRVARVPVVEALADFAAAARKDVEAKGGKLATHATVSVEGQTSPVPLDTYRFTSPGPLIRGVIRVTTTKEHVVTVTCHTEESAWNDKARAACDPVFASIRTDPRSGTTPPKGKRYLGAADVRVTVPAAWEDQPSTAPGVVALARSSSDPHTMVVVTLSETAPAGKLERRTRDAEIAKVAHAIVKLPGAHAGIKHIAPNVADIDVVRRLDGPSTTTMQACYAGARATYLVVCRGPSERVLGNAELCQTAFQSMRVEHPR